MRTFVRGSLSLLLVCATLVYGRAVQAFTDVTNKTYEKDIIAQVLEDGWMTPLSPTLFGYGVAITPNDWFYLLMFLRTDDACPEYGTVPNMHWTADNIRACLSGAGVPITTIDPTKIRRDEAMQQLFALRRKSFAFQALQTKPAGYVDPSDLSQVVAKQQGAMIAADRLKLLFRTSNKLQPMLPLLREDAALAVSRFHEWEEQGGADRETNDRVMISKEAKLNHWRDLDTDIYVTEIKTGGDTYLKPILPRRSFNPAKDSSKEKLRDEYVYQSVSDLAKESGALVAVNGSYFNVQWPWGAFEDSVMVDGKTYLERTDRSTFIVCLDGKMYIGNYSTSALKAVKCMPQHALGAGPLFISKGSVLTESTKEGFDEYTQWERRVGTNARTAVAISKDRKTAYLIVVAGKSYPAFGRGGSSLGAFLKEKYPDIGDAMMYDGGGSSALYAKGQLLVGMGISGSDAERSVISALGVFSKAADKVAAAQFKKEQVKRWDKTQTSIRIVKPAKPLVWQTVKEAKGDGITISGTRGSQVSITNAKNKTLNFKLIFDLIVRDAASKLTVTRREGEHERGWTIPTEIHVLDAKTGTDVDVIKLFAYMPEASRPDLKTFDVLAFRPSGVVFGDATGRVWFYYAKNQQFSVGKFMDPPKTTSKTPTKTPVKK